MPTYEYECPRGHVTDLIRPVDARNDPVRCECGARAKLIISPARGFVQFPAAGGHEYISPASGRYIRSARERRDDLARTGCRPYEGFEAEKKEAKRRVADAEKKSDAKLHDAVSRAYHQLSPSGKKALGG